MNKIKTLALGAFIFALFACEQPFKAGLGPVVDIRPPTVTLTSPSVGGYIHNVTVFAGTAEDDYRLDSVWVRIFNYPITPDLYLDGLRSYTKIATFNSNSGNWSFSIDTGKFKDGPFTIELKVIDSVNKTAETGQMVFTINNSNPVIKVTAPEILEGGDNGQVGGAHLNFDVVDTMPLSQTYGRQIDKGSLLTGSIEHAQDIYTGAWDGGNKYPPQIRIWEVSADGDGISSWKPGVLPPYSGDTNWKNFVMGKDLFLVDPISGSYMFTRELPEDAGKFYGFELRAQSLDGKAHLRYPRDVYTPQNPPRVWDGDGDFEKQNRYVLMYVRLPQELPTIEMWGLEDIVNGAITGGNYAPLTGISDDAAHIYVNRDPVNKNGDFVLRFKTMHPEGIRSAEVYWEKDDKSLRGRFIWDTATQTSDPSLHEATTQYYSYWGFRDRSDRDRTRNFIYTYRQPANIVAGDSRNNVPAGAHSQVSGRTKIQSYNGTDLAAWTAGKKSQTWPMALSPASVWQDRTYLPEGVYDIEVYATSFRGTPLTTPFTCSIRLDRTLPEVQITLMDGVTGFDSANPAGPTTVNGVISPQMRIDDSQIQDSGLRSSTGYYSGNYEQRYILIPAASKTAFDVLNTRNWWPPEPVLGGTPPAYNLDISGVTVSKHGPVVSGRFNFKTSKIYAGTNYTDYYPALPLGHSIDGAANTENDNLANGTYYLYVFARDNAFNVGYNAPVAITVNHISDFPEFDFSVGSIDPTVTNPDRDADNATGFRQGSSARNSLGPTSAIRLRLRDDDSLNLGVQNGAASSVKISITGSSADSLGNVTALSPPSTYELSLSDPAVKDIFNPQGTGTYDSRAAVKERQGDITQAALVALLKSESAYDYLFPLGKSSYTSLPDGIYKIKISVGDYAPAKLKTASDTADPAVATRAVEFWVAKDSVPPVISDITPINGRYIASGEARIEGIVSDQNGPITGTVIVRKDGTSTPVALTGTPDVKVPPTDNTDLWEGKFTATIPLGPSETSGTYIFTLQFTDRFGKQSTVELRYQIDTLPPTVAKLTDIKTFNRSGLKSLVPDPYPDIAAENFSMLTNGVVNFAFTASDNLNLTEARWWLVPSATTPNSFAFDAYDEESNTGGIKYDDVTAGTTLTITNKGIKYKYGKLTDNFSGKTWYVNTKNLDDGPYTLYAAAKDEANNYSAIVKLQDIYVLQEEDKPWFGAATNITPNAGTSAGSIGASQAFVRGNIYEDDGFVDGSGNVLTDSVKIYMSTSQPTNITTIADASFKTVTSGVTRAGSNVTLNIDLLDLFPTELNSDGEKFYVIEATDSWFGKFNDEDGTQATATGTNAGERLKNRKLFSFIYDSKDPVIEINAPTLAPSETTLIYGLNAGTTGSTKPFPLTASIKDAYLDTLENGNYYIMIRVNAGTYKVFDLGINATTPADTTIAATGVKVEINGPATGDRTVKFIINADKFTEFIGYNDLGSGTHTLSFQVKDQSGKVGTAGFSFLKDMTPPDILFKNISGQVLPTVTVGPGTPPATAAWWSVSNDQPGYKAKRTALDGMNPKLTIIQHDGSVSIQGTFSDTLSNIDTDSFKYYLDGSPTATPASLEGTGKNLSWTIPLSIPDGVHSIRIEVADMAGNKLLPVDYYGFILVSGKPTIEIDDKPDKPLLGDYWTTKTPLGSGVTNNDIVFAIGGKAKSPSLADIRLRLSYIDVPNSNPWDRRLKQNLGVNLDNMLTYAESPDPYLETADWSYNIPRSALRLAGDNVTSNGALRAGSYELTAYAIDGNGTESDEATWTFTIDPEQPKFEFTTPGNVTAAADANEPGSRKPAYWLTNSTTLAQRNVITSPEPKLQARISDTRSTLEKAEYQLRRYNYASDEWGEYYNGTGWVEENTWVDVLAGGTDYPWNLDIKSFVDGYYYVIMRARDSSVLYDNPPANVGNWNNTGNNPGDGNPVTERYRYFFLSRSLPQLSLDNNDTQFSSRIIQGNNLEFPITAIDNNLFEKLTVAVASPYTGTRPDITGQRSGIATWKPTVQIPFNPNAGATYCPDGAYTITFTVTNLAGRSNIITRTITLDNTPPEGKVETPRSMAVGSVYRPPLPTLPSGLGEIISGGFDADISGTNEDKGASASGVKEVWYHLGYVATAANNDANNVALAFPTEAAVTGTVNGVGLIGARDLGNTASNVAGKTNNDLFDDAANDPNTAWFKYAPGYTRPHGVAAYAGDQINWELVIRKAGTDDFANYAKPDFALKTGSTKRYNPASGTGSWMVKRIEESLLIPSVAKSGLYSMPLWVRVADAAGNVSYYSRDIWIYPNGDYPANVINNPDVNQARTAPRGGQFSIEGMASDNRSIRNVIYRVFADNKDGSTDVPADAYLVSIPNEMPATAPEFTTIPDYAPTTASPPGNDNNPFTARYSRLGWHSATFDGTMAPTRPWSFTLNAGEGGELYQLLQTPLSDGRWFDVGGTRFMRLYIQVFAFDGALEDGVDYNKISLGRSTNEKLPEPEVRILYVKNSAPEIRNLRLSNKEGNFDGYTNGSQFNVTTAGVFVDYNASDNLRNRRFALQMDLDGRGTALRSISIRLPGGSWQDVWHPTGTPAVTTPPTGVYLNNNTAPTRMTYSLDSRITAAANGFATVQNGAWMDTGGTLTVEVRIRDMSNPPGEASARYEVKIDNFAPVADEVINITPPKAAGTNVLFMGRAFDYKLASGGAPDPTHRSIEQVYAWFTRDASGTSNYINLKTGRPSATTPTSTRAAWTGRKADVDFGSGNNSNNVTSIEVTENGNRGNVTHPVVGGDFLKVLNEQEGAQLGGGVTWQKNNNSSADILWQFSADTTGMDDGWMYLNYLVIDNAGNATRYQQRMMVMNKYPQITKVTLYTDNRGEGAAFTTHDDPDAFTEYTVENGAGVGIYRSDNYSGRTGIKSSVGYINSGFISKNQAIGFGVQTMSGNGTLRYRVQYVERVPINLSNRDTLRAMAAKDFDGSKGITYDVSRPDIGNINLYTIENTGNISALNWGKLGVKEPTPQPGNHFVFRADAALVEGLPTINDKTTVFGYRMPGTTLLKTVTPADPHVVSPDALGFRIADNVFALSDATKIPEKDGSKPEEDEAVHNDPGNTAYFLIKVWDSVSDTNRPAGMPAYGATGHPYGEDDQLYDAVVIGMNVYLSDHTNPTIRLYDMNPYTETEGVVGNNLNNTVRNRTAANAAAPTALGYNILRGGLYNIGTSQKLVKSGYIDPRDGSTALKPRVKNANGVYETQNAHGYVNADADKGFSADAVAASGTTFDKVSGRIILRGQAWDDQLIDEISIRTGGTATDGGTTTPILKLLPVKRDADGNITDVITALPLPNPIPDGYKKELIWPATTSETSPARAWAVEELHWKTGHTVEWAYIWNTEDHNSGSPQTSVYVTVIVKDANGTGGGLENLLVTGENYLTETFHNQIQVDVVPYIVGFERNSNYANTRSRQGWYSFFQGETGIRLLGYNLGTAISSMGIHDGTTNRSITAGNGTDRSPTYNPAPRSYTFTMPDAAQSGRIDVNATGNVAVYNHTIVNTTYTTKSWNREHNASTAGSELWINKPYAHIWRTEQNGTGQNTYFGTSITNTDGMSRPSMALEYATNAGTLTGVWASYGDGFSYRANNGGGARTGFIFGANEGEPNIAYDISYYNGGNPNGAIAGTYEADGQTRMYIRDGGNNNNTTFATNTVMSPQDYGVSTQRWQNLRVVRSANRSHITSYDSRDKSLRYVSRTSNGAYGDANYYHIDGASTTATQTSFTMSTDAGLYSAIDYDNIAIGGTTANRPIVAYYDRANDTLRIAYASQEAPAVGNWTRSNVLPANSGAGQYVSIKVDRNNGIHLAFYNSKNQTIMYAYAPNRNSPFTAYEVDKVIKGGQWTDISVDDNGNPWIVYSDTGRMGNYDGARMAYRSYGADGASGASFSNTAGDDGRYMNAWEAVSMPSNTKVSNERLNIEAWPPTNRSATTLPATGPGWNAAIGYAGDSGGGNNFRIGYFFLPKTVPYVR